MLGLASFFYKAAEFEDLSFPIAWGGGSCLLYLGSVYWLDFGLCGALSMQLLLLVAMMAAMQFDKNRNELSFASLKARWNLRRGRCPECAYDLSGTRRLGLCPECGAEVPAEDA
jgi:hypothetical protein